MAGEEVPIVKFCRVIFCPECGTLPDEPTHKGTNVDCYVCGYVIPSSGVRPTRAKELAPILPPKPKRTSRLTVSWPLSRSVRGIGRRVGESGVQGGRP